jgi:hypothetical protein
VNIEGQVLYLAGATGAEVPLTREVVLAVRDAEAVRPGGEAAVADTHPGDGVVAAVAARTGAAPGEVERVLRAYLRLRDGLEVVPDPSPTAASVPPAALPPPTPLSGPDVPPPPSVPIVPPRPLAWGRVAAVMAACFVGVMLLAFLIVFVHGMFAGAGIIGEADEPVACGVATGAQAESRHEGDPVAVDRSG